MENQDSKKRSEMFPVYEDDVQYELNKFIFWYKENGKTTKDSSMFKKRDAIVEGHEPIMWQATPISMEERRRFNEEYEIEMFGKEVDFLDEDDILNELDNLLEQENKYEY